MTLSAPQTRTGRTPRKTRAWHTPFLEALRDCGTVAGAARIAKIGRQTAYDEMTRNPGFADAVREARDECIELVEATLYQRALQPDGTADRIFYLKTARPEKYAEKLNPAQIEAVRAEARRGALKEVQDELALLPPEPRRIVMEAMAAVAERHSPERVLKERS